MSRLLFKVWMLLARDGRGTEGTPCGKARRSNCLGSAASTTRTLLPFYCHSRVPLSSAALECRFEITDSESPTPGGPEATVVGEEL